MEKFSYVYLMGSASRRALYTGVTTELLQRVWESTKIVRADISPQNITVRGSYILKLMEISMRP
jgi:predicted GIY-YIG superfamily endonuclease